MPVLAPESANLVPASQSTGHRKQQRRQLQLVNQRGIPRFDDLLTIRVLEDSPTISLPMNTAKRQATRIPISVEPTVDDPTPTHEMVCERLFDFFDGNFNQDRESWDHFLKQVLHDTISIDTGTIELVPTKEQLPHPQTGEMSYWLKEMYASDGSLIAKNRTERNTIPNPPEPAYWKYGHMPNAQHALLSQSHNIEDLFRDHRLMRYLQGGQVKPVPYSRDEMVIVEENPRPAFKSAYGFGIVQQARRWAEILLNQDISNIRHFSDDEMAKGVITIAEDYANQLDRVRDYWKDEVTGQTDHKLPIAPFGEDMQWIPFEPSLKELQYLESQQWYSELVWYLFGQTQSEIGQSESANVSTSEHDTYQVLVNTTQPRLSTLEQLINSSILPKLRDYWIVDGEVQFRFAFEEHPVLKEHMQETRRQDLEFGLRTINDVLEAEGKDPKPWGDAPPEAVREFGRQHPEWVMETWGGVEDVPEPTSDDMGLFSHEPVETERDSGDGNDSNDSAKLSGTTKDVELSGDYALLTYFIGGEPVEDWDQYQEFADELVEEYRATMVGLGTLENPDVEVDRYPPDLPETHDARILVNGATPEQVAETLDKYDGLHFDDPTDHDATKSVTNHSHRSREDFFRNALSDPDAYLKEPLRNERAHLPPMKQHVEAGTEAIGRVFETITDELDGDIERLFPEERDSHSPVSQKRWIPNLRDAIDNIDLTSALTTAILPSVEAAVSDTAEFDAREVESEIAERLDDPDIEVVIDDDVSDTFAMERIRRHAASDMVTVNDTVKRRINRELTHVAEDGGNINDATEALRDTVDELSDSHARLVARTETLDASRHGSQALAETTDIIAGKKWRASSDGRVRPWHNAMDGEIVAKDANFHVPGGWQGAPDYQPSDYPRPAFVVGDDQPFNCRCNQQHVLPEDMPEAQGLRDIDGITVKTELTERQLEFRENHKEGNESFAAVFKRLSEEMNPTEIEREGIVSKATYYDWQRKINN